MQNIQGYFNIHISCPQQSSYKYTYKNVLAHSTEVRHWHKTYTVFKPDIDNLGISIYSHPLVTLADVLSALGWESACRSSLRQCVFSLSCKSYKSLDIVERNVLLQIMHVTVTVPNVICWHSSRICFSHKLD